MDLNPAHDPQHDEDPVNVTAMVDVVFMLLAFFVMTSSFLAAEQDMAIAHERPTSPAGASSADLPASVVVKLEPLADGRVRVTIGQSTLGADAFDLITMSLKRIDLPQTPVVIAAHPRVTVAQVARAMEAVLASPMKRLSLSRLAEASAD